MDPNPGRSLQEYVGFRGCVITWAMITEGRTLQDYVWFRNCVRVTGTTENKISVRRVLQGTIP